MIAPNLDRHIQITPGITGGKPRIAGRRITVAQVAVWHETMGIGVDEICAEHDLSLAEAHAALAYYFDHREQIDQSIAEDQAFTAALRDAEDSVLNDRLKAARGG